jgi:hypothetical protein
MARSLRAWCCLLLLCSVAGVADAGIRTRIGITIPQNGGGPDLTANLYAPDEALGAGPYPVISMLPGGGAGLSSTEWAAQRLARDGYVVCLTLPEASTDNLYARACVSGLDFLASTANPFLDESDNAKAGICGWSLGGRALTKVQDEDSRAKCVVAWDNLAVSEKGDGGSPLGNNRPQLWRTPRVPAMGQASLNGFTNSESKITAWKWWREYGQPVMTVVFEGSNHFWWSGSGSTELKRDQSHHYTRAWFDRWLKNDASASSRLLATNIAGIPINSLLSNGIRSAAFLRRPGYERPASAPRDRSRIGLCERRTARAMGLQWRNSGRQRGGARSRLRHIGQCLRGRIVSGHRDFDGLRQTPSALSTSAGAEDIFVVKNAPDGTILWARRYGGTGSDIAYDVAVDRAGRVFLCGTFQGSFSIGSFALSTPAGTTSTFTAELDANGNVVWAGATGGATSGTVISSECIGDNTGGFVVSAHSRARRRSGAQTLQTGAGETWAFLARYNASRVLQWVRTVPANSSAARGVALAGDGSGDVLATGDFAGSGSFGAQTLMSAGNSDAWLARLSGAETGAGLRKLAAVAKTPAAE